MQQLVAQVPWRHIGVSSFEIEKYIPKDILEKLPTEEDLNLHINIKDK